MIRYRCIAGFDGMEANRDGIYVRIDDHELVANESELATLRAKVAELEKDRELLDAWLTSHGCTREGMRKILGIAARASAGEGR